MHTVDETGVHSLFHYAELLDHSLIEELEWLARALKGMRVAHVNATAHGGGVAEILHSLLPLYHGLGIDAEWLVLRGDDSFFGVTKQMHNCLQGAPCALTNADWDTHAAWNEHNARFLTSTYDVVIVHDPQPVALPEYAPGAAGKWVWRSHIDTSAPDADAWRRLSAHVQVYDAAVFSLPEFAGPGLNGVPVSVMPPAIDPFTPKNTRMAEPEALSVVARYGIDPQRPFITQVSRFDPWKDPLGVIDCFRRLKPDNPELQLAMLGNFADDDPEGRVMYDKVVVAAQGTPDVHIVLGLTDLVGPFQQMSAVVLQKSLKEGFGLTATEALWKGTPVIAGNVGGLRLQVADGVGGFLVDSVDECAERVDFLLNHTAERDALGAAGREHVRKHFLLPRLLRDEMQLLHRLLTASNGSAPQTESAALEGATEVGG